MKKCIYSLFALAIAATALSSCEDVPAPYNMPQEVIDGGGETTTDPAGTGTKDDPYNVAAANQAGAALAAGQSTETVYIQGVISRIDEIDPSYGNATYYISDDGTTNDQFYVYRGYSLGGEKFTSADELKVGDKVVVTGTITNYNGTIELAQGNSIYSLNGTGGATEGSGEGTEASPYDVAKALSLIANGENDPEKEVYVKGKVSAIDEISTSFGNASYYISDDGATTTQLQVYRGYYLGGDKFTSTDQLKVGDEVVILGKLTAFYEKSQIGTGSQIVSLNGQTGVEYGTEAHPYSPSQALAAIASGDYDADAEVYVKGIVSRVTDLSTSYGNATYYVSDDGSASNELYVFRGLYLDGEKFTASDQLKAGDEVVILGKLTTYNGSPQVGTGSKLVSLTPGTSSEEPTTPGLYFTNDAVTVIATATSASPSATFNAASQGFENAEDITTITLSDGSTVTFDSNGETNGPKYYTTGSAIRVYKNNAIRFSCKRAIAKITFRCLDGYAGNETATFDVSGKEAEYVNVFTGTSGGGVQLRLTDIEVTYAD